MPEKAPRLIVNLTFPKLKGFVRLLRSDDLFAEPYRQTMDELGRYGYAQAVRNAPVRSGRTVNLMQYRVQQRPVPMWMAVKTRAVSKSPKYPRGYSYPRRHNYDPRSPHRGWWDRAISATRAVWPGLLMKATRQIGARWSKGS